MMPVAKIGVAGLPDLCEPGDTVSLEITPVDGLGRALTGREVAIVSREPSVATVGADGSVIAMAEGSAQLVIQCEKIESELDLLVSSPTVASIDIEAPNDGLKVGDAIPLVAVPRGRRGQALEGRGLEWASSDPRIAEVSQDGTVTVKAPGGAKITARCEGQVGSVELLIPTVPVVSVDVHGAPEGLYAGDRATLSAVAMGPSGQSLPDRRVAWSSAFPNIVRISPQGEVVALTSGEARLLASSEGKVAQVAFTVLPSRVERVWLSVPVEYVSVGDRLKPDLTVMDGRSNLITDRVAQWQSSRPEIVTVSAKGEMSALQVGTAEISVTVEGRSAAVDVEVRNAETARVVEPEPVRVAGVTAPAPQPRAKPPAPKPRRRPVWGAVVVVAILAAGFAWNRLAPNAVAPVTSVTILTADGRQAGPTLQMSAGESVDLTAALSDIDGARLEGVVEWSSSTPAVAAVDLGGVLTALAQGTALISASSEGVASELKLTVSAVEPPPVAVISEPQPAPTPAPPPVATPSAASLTIMGTGGTAVSSLALVAGETVSLGASAVDQGGRPVSGQIVWSSTAPGVASVGPDGLVTALGSGLSVVTARLDAATGSVQVTVAAPGPGKLQLIVLPFADVYIDGALVASEQRTVELDLDAGSHRLRLETPSMTPLDTTIVIRSGQTTPVQVRLQPGGGG